MQKILLHNSAPIQVEAIVRTVPRQRIVVRGVWNEQQVFAKLFYGERAKQHYLRDLSGVNYLVAANVSTPPLLYEGQSSIDGAPAYVLIFTAIAGAVNAEQLLAVSDQQARFDLASELVRVVATHHQANLIQTDMYPKNFLVVEQQVYSIDGDGIRHYVRLDLRTALHNLSLLLSKFDILDMEYWFDDLLVIYMRTRGLGSSLHRTAVLRLTKIYREKVASAYADKKVFRQCADVNVHQYPHLVTARASHFENLVIPAQINELDAMMTEARMLKDGNTCTVALVRIGTTDVVIKRYNIKNLTHRMSRMLRQTRASISWANAYRLKFYGIETPSPIALIEQRNFSLRGKAYFLSAYVDAPDVAAYFAEMSETALREEAIKAIVQLFYRLYLLKVSHGDMKFSNIKMLDTRPMLIDLDSMQQHRSEYFALKAHAKDVRRFMQNWKDDTSLYNAFLKAFKVVYVNHAPLEMAKL